MTAGNGTTVTITRGHATTLFRDIPATPDEGILAEGASLKGAASLEGLSGIDGSGMRGAMDSSHLEFAVSGTGDNLGRHRPAIWP